MYDLNEIFKIDILPTLTDFKNCQFVFSRAFEQNKSLGTSIKTILELGVFRLFGGEISDLPGQSTKTLMILSDYYNVDKFVSVDIDDCTSTIDSCVSWVNKRGISVTNHKFVQCNSLDFDVQREFPNEIDFIFLDTCHDDNYPELLGYDSSVCGAGTTYKEICYYTKHLSKNGRMFIHDTNNFYVEKTYGLNTDGAIIRFLAENDNFVFHEHMPNEHGLGELIRKDSDVSKLYL